LEYIMVFLFTALMSMPLLELWGVLIGIVATVLTIFLTAGKQPGFASGGCTPLVWTCKRSCLESSNDWTTDECRHNKPVGKPRNRIGQLVPLVLTPVVVVLAWLLYDSHQTINQLAKTLPIYVVLGQWAGGTRPV
jgi:hypothetical protein